MLVRDVMTSPAITVAARTSVKDGLRLLDKHSVTAMPVVGSDGHLLGIVSEADLLKDAVRHDDRAHLMPHERDPFEGRTEVRHVEDVMSTLSMTVSPDSDLCDAVELMTGTAVKSLPVIEDGRVVGVVSRSDIVHLLARSDDLIAAEIDELLRSAELSYTVDVNDGHVLLEGSRDPHQQKVAEVIAGSVQGVMSVRFR
ncbi:MAG TPA: CBS domain-containing protein [Nocardioidaceae bacterium]|nr:CBS domain-containing protein [Nocardioidaceae bacterium]